MERTKAAKCCPCMHKFHQATNGNAPLCEPGPVLLLGKTRRRKKTRTSGSGFVLISNFSIFASMPDQHITMQKISSWSDVLAIILFDWFSKTTKCRERESMCFVFVHHMCVCVCVRVCSRWGRVVVLVV